MNLRVRTQLALREAEIVFAQEIGPAVSTLGDSLRERVRAKMREDTGRSKRAIKKKITGGGYRKRLLIFGDLPQHHVDEFGRKPGGRIPPFKPGSALYKWVGRKGIAAADIATAREDGQRRALRRRPDISQTGFERAGNREANKVQRRVAFLVARKIARDGIPAVKPFERTKDESRKFVRESLDAAVNRAVRRLNA